MNTLFPLNKGGQGDVIIMPDKLEILTNLKIKLKNRFGNKIKDVILFGSQASDRANEYSDYDILIILNSDYDTKFEDQIIDICYDIDLKYNILTDTHILSKNELNTLRGRQPVFTNAMKNGIYA